MTEQERFLSARDIAEIISVSVRTVRRWIRDGILPSVRIGGARRVSEKHLIKLLGGDSSKSIDSE